MLEWDTVVNDITYLIRYKEADEGDDKWTDNMIPEEDTTFTIMGLKTCTDYQIQIISICQVDSSSSYEEIIMTTGTNCQVSVPQIAHLNSWKSYTQSVQ